MSERVFSSRTLSVTICRPPGDVYDFVSNPENLPRWAKGLGQSVRQQGPDWVVETPEGALKIRFAEKNRFGVLDHFVTLPSGMEIHVPMRVLPNGSGSEVVFTLFHLPGMAAAKFAEDLALVDRDLNTLREILEK